MKKARPRETIITERTTEEKAPKYSKRADVKNRADAENKTIQTTYQYYNPFVPHNLSMKKHALVKSSNNNLTFKHA